FALVVRGVVARGLAEPEHAADLLADALGYCEKTGHPLLIGIARTLRGQVALDRGQPAVAEVEARAVLAVVEPHDALPAAQVGPRVLLACARLARDEPASAAQLLAPIAQAADDPSLLFSRRQAVAEYANALLADGRPAEAVRWARRAIDAPAEDVRSLVVATRVLADALAADGQLTAALATAEEAVRLAYGTQQVGERGAADALRNDLAGRLAAANGPVKSDARQ
ncbi:MAG TPA: adenylate/guanylate cyclase domain-containing protein, partial [Pilimelia sp.]|nr:adenylate/guanylate cyclase domain-containing protein [Pilimelia sp.]